MDIQSTYILDQYFLVSDLSPNTKKLYRQSFKLLLAFAKKDILEITSEDIARFRESRAHLKRTTLNKDLMAFSSFFSWAEKENLVNANPVARIKKYRLKKSERIRENYVSHEDALKLIEEPLCPKIKEPRKIQVRDHAILATLYFGGLRVSELCNLRVSDFRGTLLYVEESKGHKSRLVEIPAILQEIIKWYIQKCRPEGFLFGKGGKKISTNAVRDLVKKYAIRLGIQAIGDKTTVTPVTLRHSYATHLIALGVSELVLGELMGNPTAVYRYAHPTQEAKRRAANLMEES